jgi:hypothetical protein
MKTGGHQCCSVVCVCMKHDKSAESNVRTEKREFYIQKEKSAIFCRRASVGSGNAGEGTFLNSQSTQRSKAATWPNADMEVNN